MHAHERLGVCCARSICYNNVADDAPIIRRYTDFDEMKADEYRYWQSRPAHERLGAVEDMIETPVYAALAEFGAPLGNTRPGAFTDRSRLFRFGYDPKSMDIHRPFLL